MVLMEINFQEKKTDFCWQNENNRFSFWLYTLQFKVLVDDILRNAKQEQTSRNHNPSYKNISFPFQEMPQCKNKKKTGLLPEPGKQRVCRHEATNFITENMSQNRHTVQNLTLLQNSSKKCIIVVD
jgi:hypothetical protein